MVKQFANKLKEKLTLLHENHFITINQAAFVFFDQDRSNARKLFVANSIL